jgi:GNAT superfamily N-acetyltransferase
MIQLRKYKPSDQKQVYELVDSVIKEIFHFELRNAYDLLDIKQHYTDKGGIFYVALDDDISGDNQIIGTIGVFLNSDGCAKIKRMYVNQAYRKKGIGQKLMNKVMRFCKLKKYNTLTLTTYPQMKAAIDFYIRNGFKKVSIAKDGGIIMVLKFDDKRQNQRKDKKKDKKKNERKI